MILKSVGILLLLLFAFSPVEAAGMKADAIVLLAGDIQARAPLASMLLLNGSADRIILTNDGVFSNWSPEHGRNLYQVEWAEESLVSLGVPRYKIIRLPYYGNSSTICEALAVRAYVRKHPLKSLILTTSDYHMARSLLAFKVAFAGEPKIDFIEAASISTVTIGGKIKEYGKLVYYFFFFYLFRLSPDIIPS